MNKQKILLLICAVLLLWKCFDYFIMNNRNARNYTVSEAFDEIHSKEMFKVSIYYEALCSDSRYFILKQLVPTYENLHDYITIDFIPYGKAETIEKEEKIFFKCQHGTTECVANKIHACTLNLINDQNLQLKIVACMINDNVIPHEAGQKCADELGIDYNPIQECVDSKKSSLLLKVYGERTNAVSPPITFIPTIEINDSPKIPLPQVLKDFNTELCKLFLVKPKECV